MKAVAKIGNSNWQTAIWYDSKKSTYILPIKAEIRKKEKNHLNQKVEIQICI